MYYILYSILYLLSLLPLKLLYIFSDIIYFLLYHIFQYRRKITFQNLLNSFPEKTNEELLNIASTFYKNLSDSIVETIKLISISKKELTKRIICNWEIFEQLEKDNKNAQAYMSHQFNWEWATVVCNWNIKLQFVGLYMPVNNKVIDKLFYKLRSRSNTKLIKVQDMQKEINKIQNQKILWGFIADQNPSDPKRVSWNDFLNRKTAFFKGPEYVARRYNNIVYFGEIIKIKRGYYEIKMKLAFDNPQSTKEGEITEAYVRHLEECIKRQPSNWVWSHRRWKHQFNH